MGRRGEDRGHFLELKYFYNFTFQMSTAETNQIKLNLIEWINRLSDTDVISFLDGLRNSRTKNDWWDELSEVQKKQIMAGLNDVEKGNMHSSKEFWEKIKNA
jgi:hypothetical protein